ncbi:MAG TPA: MFS transporter [Pirellulales bacterium]|jgi:MFS family permease|nr:MFS transporter [Pirellulales bacterium]
MIFNRGRELLTAARAKLRPFARSLAHRNYRLFIFGQGISLIGTWMQQVALGWLVYDLTGSPFWLGIVGFCGQIPAFFIAPVAGVLTDRWNLRGTLLVTQSACMLQAAMLAALDVTGAIAVWQIVPLSLFSGVVNAFDMPARQAFLVHMVDRKEDLPNAIALNSSLVNGTRLIGPAISGLVIDLAGEATCFLLNALSYVAVLWALWAMRIAPRQAGSRSEDVWRGLRTGLGYAFGFAPIRDILLLLGLMSLCFMPLGVLMPVFAREILQGGPDTLGLMTGASGVGALGAALYLASRSSVLGLGRQIAMSAAGLGLSMFAFSLSRDLGLSLALLLFTGYCTMLGMAASNTLLQTIVDEDKRGRVMGLYATAFMGMAPMGSLLAGLLADALGAPAALRVCGALSLAGGVAFALRLPELRNQVRPIYARMGIIPEIATAIGASTQLRMPPEQ